MSVHTVDTPLMCLEEMVQPHWPRRWDWKCWVSETAITTPTRPRSAGTGDVPLHGDIREGADTGCPVVALQPDSPLTAAYLKIAARVLDLLPQPETDNLQTTRSSS